jgi:hypothetical protein
VEKVAATVRPVLLLLQMLEKVAMLVIHQERLPAAQVLS